MEVDVVTGICPRPMMPRMPLSMIILYHYCFALVEKDEYARILIGTTLIAIVASIAAAIIMSLKYKNIYKRLGYIQ